MSRKVFKNWGHPLVTYFSVWGYQAKKTHEKSQGKEKSRSARKIPPTIENRSSAMSHWAILGKFAMQMMLIKFDWLVNDLHCKIFLRLSSWANQSRFSVDCGQSKTDNYLMNRLDSMRGKFEAGRAILYKLWTTCEV